VDSARKTLLFSVTLAYKVHLLVSLNANEHGSLYDMRVTGYIPSASKDRFLYDHYTIIHEFLI